MADKIDLGSVAYVLGVLSIVFAFLIPFSGLVLGIVGLVHSKREKAEKAKKLNIIGIVLSVILWIVYTLFFRFLGGGVNSGSFPVF